MQFSEVLHESKICLGWAGCRSVGSGKDGCRRVQSGKSLCWGGVEHTKASPVIKEIAGAHVRGRFLASDVEATSDRSLMCQRRKVKKSEMSTITIQKDTEFTNYRTRIPSCSLGRLASWRRSSIVLQDFGVSSKLIRKDDKLWSKWSKLEWSADRLMGFQEIRTVATSDSWGSFQWAQEQWQVWNGMEFDNYIVGSDCIRYPAEKLQLQVTKYIRVRRLLGSNFWALITLFKTLPTSHHSYLTKFDCSKMYSQTILAHEQDLLDRLPDRPLTILRRQARSACCICIDERNCESGRIPRNCTVILDGDRVSIASCYCCRVGKDLGCRFKRQG